MSISLQMKKKKVKRASLLAVALTAANVGVAAAGGLTVEPQCPSSISPGAPLKVELVLTNTTQTVTRTFQGQSFSTSQGKTFNIAKTGLIAHLGNLNVLGPFVIPLSLTLDPLPPITIDLSNPSSLPLTPTEPKPFTTTGYLNVAFPTTAARGTFTHIGISVLDQDNKTLGSGGCVIEVK